MESAVPSGDSGGEAGGGCGASGGQGWVGGKLFTWGMAKLGQLGTGKEQTEHTPQPIRLPRGGGDGGVEGGAVTQVSCGGLHTAALTQQGDVFTTGCGKYGRLATGDEQNTSTFVRVALPGKVKQISCGVWHGAAVTVAGGLLVWGHRKGCGSSTDNSAASSVLTPPTLLLSPSQYKVAGVTCGHNYTLAWTEDGKVLSWGSGHNGVLGQGTTDDVTSPTIVAALTDEVVVQASAGHAHSAFVTSRGRVFTCGKGKDGALGLGQGRLEDATSPKVVTFPEEVKVVQVSCSVGEHHGHTLALTGEGRVYVWGDGYKGKLGVEEGQGQGQGSRWTPTLVPPAHFQQQVVSSISAGGIHSAAATSSGAVFTWGCGSDGRMGHPEGQGHRYLFRSDVPKRVEALASFKGRRAVVSCSYYHTAAIVG